jgi:DNA gyrase subunit B
LKDERAYEDFLLDEAGKNLKLRTEKTGRPYAGQNLKQILKKLILYRQLIDKAQKRGIGEDIIDIVLDNDFRYRYLFEQVDKFDAMFQLFQAAGYDVDKRFNEEQNLLEIRFPSTIDKSEMTLGWNQVGSHEMRELFQIRSEVQAVRHPPFVVIDKKDVEHSFDCQEELIEFVFKVAKTGMNIQRYKGLGEMNADQLWETTMDNERRTLLQVDIASALSADEIFSILMGDNVLPRKEFIQEFALEANLDI